MSVTLVLALGEKELGVLTFQLGNKTVNISMGVIQKEKEFNLEEYKEKLNGDTFKFIKENTDEEEDNFIVIFKNDIEEDILTKTNIKKQYKRFKGTAVRGKVKDIKELIENNEIKYLELDQNLELLGENIPYNIEKTNAPNVWDRTTGKKVKVAILDTGIDKHKDLKVKNGVSFVSSDFNDNNGHGTAVAGVTAALLNNKGIVGVAPDVDLYAVKIMESNNGDLSNAIAGVEWAIDNNMDIVSMSFGMESYSQIFKEVLDEAYNNGILLIAAAGNEGNDNILYPARYSDVIAVGAVDKDNNKAAFSSYGYELELVAPGVDINSTGLNNEYSISSGTSMAAPHVAGVAALIKAYSSLTNAEIRAQLRNDALDLGASGKDDYYGYGLVRVNLETINITPQNESYFYEIFNITNYGTEYEDYIFWLNGTGTIDDVDFNAGYYLSRKYLSKIIEEKFLVLENGTIILLVADYIDLSDTYTYECPGGSCDDDGVAWKDGTLQASISPKPGETILAECFDWEDNGEYDACYGSQGNIDECKVDTTFNNACDDVGCTSSGSVGSHNMDTSTSKQDEVDSIYCYYEATYESRGQPYKDYYICSKRQYICISDTQYVDRCITDSGPDYTFSTETCPSGETCDYSQDEDNADFGSSGTSQPQSPCTSTPKCNGTIEVITEDHSGSALTSLSVYLNNVFNGSTDEVGRKDIKLYNVNCDTNQNITVKCSDNTTVCGIKSTQIDVNDDTDYLYFDCTKCSSEDDLYISQSDIYVDTETNVVKATVHSTGITSSVLVVLYRQDEDGIIQETDSDTISITAGSEQNASFNLDNLDPKDYLHIYVDSNNSVKNEDETNNYIFRAALKPIKAYIDVDVDPSFSILNDLIREYIASFADEVSSTSNADVIIMVGNPYFSNSEPFILGKNKIIANGKPITRPYGGIVKSGPYFDNEYSNSNKPYVLVYGNRIEGTIAAVKRMINARNIFLDKEAYDRYYTSYIDDYDTLGISVMDLMHNNEAQTYFNQNNSGLNNIVRKILFDNNFEVSVKPVKTLNTTSYSESTILRVKHVNSDFSADYKDVVGISDKPVVMSKGIHSNLFTWEDFGKELAADGQDVWLIEMVGGPYTDEDCGASCPDYTFADLKDYYWPALIAGIQEYSGKNQIDYVGHSLGCSAALESLESHQNGENNIGYYFDYNSGQYLYSDLASNPVDTFVAIACPGNFSKLSFYMYLANYTEKESNLIQNMKNDGQTHPTQKRVVKEILKFLLPIEKEAMSTILSSFSSPNRMSIEIYQSFVDWMNDPAQPKIGENVNLNNFMIIQGKITRKWWHTPPLDKDIDTDNTVPTADEAEICRNVNSNNKYYVSYNNTKHHKITRSSRVKEVIRDFLEDNDLDSTEGFDYNQNCELI